MITQLKSVVLSLGMIDRHLSVQEAVLLSRLEEEYQVGENQRFPSRIYTVSLCSTALVPLPEKTGKQCALLCFIVFLMIPKMLAPNAHVRQCRVLLRSSEP